MKKGILDLSTADLDGKIYRIEGAAEFYWNRFIEPSDFENAADMKPEYVSFPAVWNRLTVNGKKLSDYGYATYRIQILLPESVKELEIRVPYFNSAYRLYADGRLIGNNGTPGMTRKESVPATAMMIYDIPVRNSRIDLVVHVSNFHGVNGGIDRHITVGLERNVLLNLLASMTFNYLLFGFLMLFFLFYLLIYCLNPGKFQYLYLFLLSLLMAFRVLFSYEKFVTLFFSAFSYEMILKIEYFSIYCSIIIYILYYRSMFPAYFQQQIIITGVLISAILTVPVLVTPAEFYTKTLLVFEILASIVYVYCIWNVVRALLKKESGAVEVLTGSLILVIVIVNDVLSSLYVINTPMALPLGFLVFVLIQSILNFNRINFEMKKNQVLYQKTLLLNQQLEHEIEEKNILQNEVIRVNETLENTVHLRTGELQKKNQELNRALSEIKSLSGLLPICSCCKKIRDDGGYWEQLEVYLSKHSEAQFSHSLCPECYDNQIKDHTDSAEDHSG